MKLVAAMLGAVLLAGCSAATAATQTPAGSFSAAAVPDAPLLASEGGIMRPIENGARLALQNGYVTVRLAPSPQSMDPVVQVAVFDRAGQPVAAEVAVDYESIDMDHGQNTEPAVLRDGSYRARLSFAMQGIWRLVIHVKRAGVADDKVTLVLPWVGL